MWDVCGGGGEEALFAVCDEWKEGGAMVVGGAAPKSRGRLGVVLGVPIERRLDMGTGLAYDIHNHVLCWHSEAFRVRTRIVL